MGITNKWLNPYQRSYQQIKAKLIESLTNIKDKDGNVLVTDYSEGNILIIIWQGNHSCLLLVNTVQ